MKVATDVLMLLISAVAFRQGAVAIRERRIVVRGAHSRRPGQAYEGRQAVVIGGFFVALGIAFGVWNAMELWRLIRGS